jgi:hypothetical protein
VVSKIQKLGKPGQVFSAVSAVRRTRPEGPNRGFNPER